MENIQNYNNELMSITHELSLVLNEVNNKINDMTERQFMEHYIEFLKIHESGKVKNFKRSLVISARYTEDANKKEYIKGIINTLYEMFQSINNQFKEILKKIQEREQSLEKNNFR